MVKSEGTLITYFLKNISDGMLMVDTKLKDKDFKQKKTLTFMLLKDGKENVLSDMGGYSAKELYNSKGIEELVKKGYLKKRELKQNMMVKSK